MILYRKEPINLQMKNIILLDDSSSGGVVYVNKATYDQALILHNRFDGNVDRVIATLKSKSTEAYVAMPGLKGLIDTMARTMPEPLNILAPFLMYCVKNNGISWQSDDRELAYGILHQYSQLVDFNAITLVPVEVRANINVPTSVIKNYKESWDELCSTLNDKVVLASPVKVEDAVPAKPIEQAVVAEHPEKKKNVISSTHPENTSKSNSDDAVLAPGEKAMDSAKAEAINSKIAAMIANMGKPKTPSVSPTPGEPSKLTPKEAKDASEVLDEFEGL